ncbi:MAG: lipase maturation factor family protein [Acidimicrobiales bacterium]|nr:lipase maturation factor family protein [Acidimicrobiales bacterium]
MHWSSAPDYGLSVVVFQRALAVVYLLAFVAAARQNRALLGTDGMQPVDRYVRTVSFRQSPSLFHLRSSDAWLLGVAWTGALVSAGLLLGVADALPRGACMALWAVPWALYLSIVNVGQTWYAFGWETLLVEAGFLAIFLGPAGSAPTLVLWLLRWLLFRVEFGAGLIKLRGDACWRDLTCLRYHHESQPMPGPLSWWFHHLPMPLHRVEVAANHLTQLVVPLGLFAPQPVARVAAGVMIVTQLWLMASGNFSWLNALTIAIALPVLGNDVWTALLPAAPPDVVAPPTWHHAVVIGLTALVGLLSVAPVRNLLSPRQRMNTAHDPLRLVNSYGAFGNITRVRREVVVEGTDADAIAPDTEWREYGFRGKPGDPHRRPPQVAPYHLRLDWLMWFAAISPRYASGWFAPFVARLLVNDPATLRLLRHNPFPDRPPTYVRARLYEYRFTTRAERRETGAWWHREALGTFLAPVRRAASTPTSVRDGGGLPRGQRPEWSEGPAV